MKGHRHYKVVCSRCERTVRQCPCAAYFKRTDKVENCAICRAEGVVT